MNKDIKSLNDLTGGSLNIETPETNAPDPIIPRVGGEEETVTPTGAVEESVYENPLTKEEMDEINKINELANQSPEIAATGMNLDFSGLFARTSATVQEVADKYVEEQAEKREEEEAEKMINDTFEDEFEADENATYNVVTKDIDEDAEDEEVDVENVSQSSFDLPEDFIESILNEEEANDSGEITEEEKKRIEEQFDEDLKTASGRLKELLSDTEKSFNETKAVSVNKKPISINSFLNRKKSEKLHEAEWVLYGATKKITMSALSANEIILLDVNASSKSRLDAIRDAYKVIYDHITSQKPETFEQWLKTEKARDLNHYYFCAYRATFENANHFPNVCDNEQCNHLFLTENIDIFDMVEFEDDKVKELFYEILNNGYGLDPNPVIETRVIPIGDNIAVGLKEPTLYSAVYEYQALPDSFIRTYGEMLLILSYIDQFYIIDDGEYRPLYIKEYPNNIAKTIKYKIAACSKIINSLTSDEYGKLISYVKSIRNKENAIKYHFPDVACPKCGTVVQHDKDENGLSLLFKRHQLVTTLNTWEK